MGKINLKNHLKVNVKGLCSEILLSKDCAILKIPLLTLLDILEQVATRASQLNDVELNKLMMRLALYEVSDPSSKDYDADYVRNYLSNHVENFTINNIIKENSMEINSQVTVIDKTSDETYMGLVVEMEICYFKIQLSDGSIKSFHWNDDIEIVVTVS